MQITDTIAFDLPTFSNASKDALYCQLVHELLHTVGLDENEVNNCIMPACIAALTAAKPFIDMLMDQREEAYLCFEIASKSVRENNTDLTNKLIAICEKLSDFPASPDDVIYTDTYATIYNTLSVECINTIFM